MSFVKIATFDYSKGDYGNWELPFDYHCLYILEDGRTAYIGETKDIVTRSKQHKNEKNDECYNHKFPRIHVITERFFNETVAKHCEVLLVRLMGADGKFKLLNKRDNEWQHYADENKVELFFDKLWRTLENMGLVKHKSFQEVMNLSEYKYSPYMPLTKSQKNTLTSIINTINSQETRPHRKGFLPRPILIEGDAGTGKTVVATSLFYYLRMHDSYKNLKIGLVYSARATRAEIQEVFKSVPGLYKKDVISPIDVTKEHYDIIICDETQRLRHARNAGRYYTSTIRRVNENLGLSSDSDELDWILTQSDYQILFYDPKQTVCPADITQSSFDARFKDRRRGIRPVKLTEQKRIRAGADYVPYIYNILNQKAVKARDFVNYDFKLFNSFDEMVEKLKEKENCVGLSRLCAGYSWKWISKDTPDVPDIKIENTGIWWNGQSAGWIRNDSAKYEMGSIYTLPGLDLNYAAIVIGPEVYYDDENGCIKVKKSCFYDNKVKRNCTDEEFKKFILNTYAVFMTRGIRGTYVYVCDDNLRGYLKKYIQEV